MLNTDAFSERDRYISSHIVSALKKAGIPYRVLPTDSLFNRLEIQTLLAYIYLAINPESTPLLIRILEGPKYFKSKVSRS
jgi:DNA helicase-2/ATP-dependent DNA helicase PcrA